MFALPVAQMLEENFVTYLFGSYWLAAIALIALIALITLASRMPIYGVFFLTAPVIVGLSEVGAAPFYFKAVAYIIAAALWFFAIMMLLGER